MAYDVKNLKNYNLNIDFYENVIGWWMLELKKSLYVVINFYKQF